MTFEKILSDLSAERISAAKAFEEVDTKDKRKKIHFYSHISDITKEPLNDGQLQELNAIVEILQILDNSAMGSPVNDAEYDSMQELLIDMGIPRLTGSTIITSQDKVTHKYKNLRGTLDKVYYLSPDEPRTNKSRKYLHEWVKRMEAKYESITGKKINLMEVSVILQPKFDGASVILEKEDKMRWITRGDTRNNLATDVSHIMNIFDHMYSNEVNGTGIKYELMCSEDNKEKINEFYRHHPYHNSRQIVTATLNSLEADFKAEYLYPIPLRIMKPGDEVEHVHPFLIENFPTEICKLGDIDKIKEFANKHHYINFNGMRFRTDGAVMTILDDDIKLILGRENNINNFEVAYKFTEEIAYSKVRDIEFYVSNFGYITPVLVINELIMKGNRINRISLSNKERFDELNFSYGDDVKVSYDIIPYASIDEKCKRMPVGRKIEFVRECPRCHEDLPNLDNAVMVRCMNPNCPTRLVGRVYNYCSNLRIQNLGFQTLDNLYAAGLLDNGIVSIYKLKKKAHIIEDLEGFGRTKTRKIIKEIEAKRKLRDADFFGSLGITGISIKTFEEIFSTIKLSDFMNMIKVKNWDLLLTRLLKVKNVGDKTAEQLVNYFKDPKSMREINKLFREVKLNETYGSINFKGRVTFTGCRPNDDLSVKIRNAGYNPTDGWSDKETKFLIVPSLDYDKGKVSKALEKGIPIISIQDDVIKRITE